MERSNGREEEKARVSESAKLNIRDDEPQAKGLADELMVMFKKAPKKSHDALVLSEAASMIIRLASTERQSTVDQITLTRKEASTAACAMVMPDAMSDAEHDVWRRLHDFGSGASPMEHQSAATRLEGLVRSAMDDGASQVTVPLPVAREVLRDLECRSVAARIDGDGSTPLAKLRGACATGNWQPVYEAIRDLERIARGPECRSVDGESK